MITWGHLIAFALVVTAITIAPRAVCVILLGIGAVAALVFVH